MSLFKVKLPSYHRQGKGPAVVTGRDFQLRDQCEKQQVMQKSMQNCSQALEISDVNANYTEE